jgi:hypothetical protein
MKREDLLAKFNNAGAVVGSGVAKSVEVTGAVGHGAVREVTFTGNLLKAFGSGIKKGWKDERNNVKTLSHTPVVDSDKQITPHIIIADAQGNIVGGQ